MILPNSKDYDLSDENFTQIYNKYPESTKNLIKMQKENVNNRKKPMQRLSTKIDKYDIEKLSKPIMRKSTNKVADIGPNRSAQSMDSSLKSSSEGTLKPMIT